MTITRRLGIGYAVMSSLCLLLLAWLWHHEFVEEPAEFAARGLTDLHKDTSAEFATVFFLGFVPILLGAGWWWTWRVLEPLRALTRAAEQIGSENLRASLPRTMNQDEVDRLAQVLSLMTARLDASFQQIREFTLHASHELKTPLTVMRAQLETRLREGEALPPAQGEWLGDLLDEVQRLAKIVDSLTLLTKADAGLVALERQSVAFGELVEEAFEDAVIMAQPEGVQVALGEHPGAIVAGDRHRLRQLLLILLDNAIKYNRPGGKVEISLRERGGLAELRVVNDGEGLSPGAEQRLFQPFVRGDKAVGRVEGCGLGLTIAEWIVRAHAGSIRLSSDANGRTTAMVTLPLASGSSAKPALA